MDVAERLLAVLPGERKPVLVGKTREKSIHAARCKDLKLRFTLELELPFYGDLVRGSESGAIIACDLLLT